MKNNVQVITPAKDKRYYPAVSQWNKVLTMSEFMAGTDFTYRNIAFIDFNKSYIQLWIGGKVPFDGISESQFIAVCNGIYYEDAQTINEKDRV